jgi:ComF family protein
MSDLSKILITPISYLKEAYFPSFCVHCQATETLANRFLCQSCFEQIELIKTPTCPACGRLNNSGKYCSNCGSGSALTGLIVSARFEGPVKELIHYMKYEKMQQIAVILAEFLSERIKLSTIRGQKVLVPVPLHLMRQLDRGFNQSELMAREISKTLEIPLIFALKRAKNSRQQMKLKRVERLSNLEGAFKCLNPEMILGKTVLLVDDVSTTGATLSECAKVLRAAGARQVWGVVVARG